MDFTESNNGNIEITEEEYNRFLELKERAMSNILGEMYEFVGHAIIPFQVGGAVDMYYFDKAIEGTAFATMELIEYENQGPILNKNGMYELVAFTKHKINLNANKLINKITGNKFEKIERRFCGIFTALGQWSYEEKFEPGETCELPQGEGNENICLVFDEYKIDDVDFKINGKNYGLLLCIEVFRSEMEYAMEYGSEELLKKLKEKGYYPYSDLDRKPVI